MGSGRMEANLQQHQVLFDGPAPASQQIDLDRQLDFHFAKPLGSDVKAGDIVLTCNPWVSVVSWVDRTTTCAFCWMPSRLLRACKKCHYCHYCDEKCQNSHWEEEHRRECSVLGKLIELLELDSHTPRNLLSPSSEILFFKVLIRCKDGIAEKQPSFRGQSILEYFCERHNRPRWDRFGIPEFCDHMVELHEKAGASIRRIPPAGLIPYDVRRQIATNVLMTSEFIKKDYFAGGLTAGVGLYPAPGFLQAACRGNCAWVFSGKKFVLKTLVDIPDFQSLDQLSVTPLQYGRELLTRMEKQRMICIQRFSSFREMGFNDPAELWPCRCVHCSDGREAEHSPMICVTPSCMEPIPSDSRANEPCQQCGAENSSRLAAAREEFVEFNKKLVKLLDAVSAECFWMMYDEAASKFIVRQANKTGLDFEAAYELEREMQASRLIHPDCMVKNVLWYRISDAFHLQHKIREAWKYRKNVWPS